MNAEGPAHPDGGQFSVVHQAVHGHLADPHQRGHLGDGEKLSSGDRLAIRRTGIYFAMITLALAQMVYFVVLQVRATGGEDGFQGVPRGNLFGLIPFWSGADIDLKNQIGLYPSPEDAGNERSGRSHDRWLLLQALAAEKLLPAGIDPDDPDGTPLTPALAAAIHGYLSRSPACVLMVQIDDLMEEPEQINLPGTVEERPNWRRRLSMTANRLPTTPLMRALKGPLADRNGPPA